MRGALTTNEPGPGHSCERRRAHPIEWVVLIGLATQLVVVAYAYGRLNQRVDDMLERIIRIEMVVLKGAK